MNKKDIIKSSIECALTVATTFVAIKFLNGFTPQEVAQKIGIAL